MADGAVEKVDLDAEDEVIFYVLDTLVTFAKSIIFNVVQFCLLSRSCKMFDLT